MWSERDIGFVAGLFEGEGYCGLVGNSNKYRGFTYAHKPMSPRFRISMTDTGPLLKIQRIMGFGKIQGPYKNKRHKVYFNYSLDNRKHIEIILDAIYQDLSPRRQEQACICLGREYDNDDYYYEMGL